MNTLPPDEGASARRALGAARATVVPVRRRVLRGLSWWNVRHPWDHNAHFHPWILRRLPAQPGRVLDVGCGRGDLLATLRERCDLVEGIDPDPDMSKQAAERFGEAPGVTVWRRSLHDHARAPGMAGTYDAITMVASLHHMPLGPSLEDVRCLLRSGGRLLIVTLARPEGASDLLWETGNVLLNPLVGLVTHPRPAASSSVRRDHGGMPLRSATTTVQELQGAARTVLPGARLRRREAFRITLSWTAPQR